MALDQEQEAPTVEGRRRQGQKVKRQGMVPDDRWFNGNLNVNGRRGEDRWPRTADEGGRGVRPLERDRRLDPGRAAGGRGGQRCQRGHRRRSGGGGTMVEVRCKNYERRGMRAPLTHCLICVYNAVVRCCVELLTNGTA